MPKFLFRPTFFPLFFLFFATVSFLTSSGHAAEAEPWKIAGDRMVSKFARDVDPANPWPEYPRPQMVREAWMNLNGLWEYAVTPRGAEKPERFDGRILVPFPVESALSGVGKQIGADDRLWYRRNFELPNEETWKGRRILLHFGAVDWETVVEVNGRRVGLHAGGHDPFSFDITDFLKPDGPQEICVAVWDPTDDSHQPRGKQVAKPEGIWYSPVSGIWQTVWLEPVADASITRLKPTPDIRRKSLTLETFVRGARDGDLVDVRATLDDFVVTGRGKPGEPIVLSIPEPRLWSPQSPVLYDLQVSLLRDGRTIDSVDSYFGMREIAIGKDEKGITRLLFNGRFEFQHGLLDQGWWPDGLYTPPTDEALKYDIVVTRELGYNMIRKHVKVEPARFYYHCDRLGILVWQDMPSGEQRIRSVEPDLNRSPESAATFEKELVAMIDALYGFPCIVVWVPFNEGWGQYDTTRILQWTKQLDPSRVVDGPSGWADRGSGEMRDMHSYRGPGMFPAEEHRASVVGEYGAIDLAVKGHLWTEPHDPSAKPAPEDLERFRREYARLNARLHPLIGRGLSAAVYTQTTDLEREPTGLMTYDREIIKGDVKRFRAMNDALRFPAPTWKTILPTALEAPSEWSYTTERPLDGWEKPDFDDSSWKKGESGFGRGHWNANVGTEWTTRDIWLRKTIEVDASDLEFPSQLRLSVFYDDDTEIHVNGVEVARLERYVTYYRPLVMRNVKEAFKPGKNVLAVHCFQRGGNQYIDLGMERIIPSTEAKKRVW